MQIIYTSNTGLVRLYIAAILLFFSATVQAQRYDQLTFGAGGGLAAAYAGAPIAQTNPVFYVDAAYYPFPLVNAGVELQDGQLSGTTTLQNRNHKAFTNNYKAVVLDANLFLGAFFQPGGSGFFNIIRNFYAGAGYGDMINQINYLSLGVNSAPNRESNNLRMIPFKLGYEYNIINDRFSEPVLKLDLSFRFNYIIGKGVDGYYDNYTRSFDFYNFYAVGLKYTIVMHHTFGRGYAGYD